MSYTPTYKTLFLSLIFIFLFMAKSVYADTGIMIPFLPENTDDVVEKILKTTELTATTTEIQFPQIESSSTPIQSIESSTTTLSISAPMIKLWQDIHGIQGTSREGTKNKEVLVIQGALLAFAPSFKDTYISGYFGQKTTSAVKELQKNWGLPETGTVGPKTRDMINKKYLNDLCPQRETVDRAYENVNRDTYLPIDYVPPELEVLKDPVKTTGIICLTSEPARRLEQLFKDAKKSGIKLVVFSGYRRAEIQKLLQEWSNKNKLATSTAQSLGLAESGHSEHQLGTTVDIAGSSLGYIGPDQRFGNTKEGKWLQNNSYKYGFIMSYPKGKEGETGYIYEPWHFRYIGVDNAKDIHDENLTLKEYFDLINNTSSSTITNY